MVCEISEQDGLQMMCSGNRPTHAAPQLLNCFDMGTNLPSRH